MSVFNNKVSPNLELKIENMIEKLIETDEELEKKGDYNESKFTKEISDSEDDKIFEKDFFINSNLPNEENNNNNKTNILPKNIIKPNLSQNIINTTKHNLSTINNNIIYNNYPQALYYNPLFSQQINKTISNNTIGNPPSNSNIYSNATTSFSTNYDNSYVFNPNPNISKFFQYNNNMNFKDNNSNFQNFNNSFYAGDKNCFHENINNNYKTNLFINNNNIINPNVEIEILLIEIKKILNKSEKIDLMIYNKLKGKFEQIICTHKGSRIFQNYLKNTHVDILHQIFLELKNKLILLLKDNYANYFCKKFFICLNQKDRIEFLTIIQNDLSSLAIDFIATYPIQGIIENVGSKAEKKIIYNGIKESINVYCYNVYGIHILEKVLSYFEEEFVKEIIDYVFNNFIDLSYHINGICIVKKLLLMTHKKDLHNKIKIIIKENAHNLIVHQYGNYVIQTIVENWDDKELEEILYLYKNKYKYLSMQKYSSNVMERILEKSKKNVEIYINEICNNNIIEIIKNKFGNYVVQKAVKLSSGISMKRIIGEINKNLYQLEDKRIVNKWKAIISSKYCL